MKLQNAIMMLNEGTGISSNTIEIFVTKAQASIDEVYFADIGGVLRDMFALQAKEFLTEAVNTFNRFEPKGSGGGTAGSIKPHKARTKKVIGEATDVSKEEGAQIKEWSKEKIQGMFDPANEDIAGQKAKILAVIRSITGFETLEVSIFYDDKIRNIINNIVSRMSEVIKRVKNSLRGATTNIFGSGIESIVQNAIRKGDYSKFKDLSKIEPIIKNLPKKYRNGIVVNVKIIKPVNNNAVYDLEVRFAYEKKMIFGIHIKLLASEISVSGMGNKIPIFGESTMKNIEEAFAAVEKKLGVNLDNYVSEDFVTSKGTKKTAYKVKVLELVLDILNKKGIITDSPTINFITKLCRIHKTESLWVLVFPGKVRVNFSEETNKIEIRDSNVCFIKDDRVVFKMNKDTGFTLPVVRKKERNADTE